jgi:hypothetical protein
MQEPARRLERARVRVGDIDATGRLVGWRVGLGGEPNRRPSFIRPLRPIGLAGVVRANLGGELLFQASLGVANAGRTPLRNRTRFGLALGVESTSRGLQPLLAALGRGQLARQLVAATLAEALVFRGVDLAGVAQDLLGERPIVGRRALGRVGVHPRPIDREHRDARQAGLGAQAEDLPKHLGECLLVALTKARDRRVIGLPVGRDEAHRDILNTAALDHPRRALPARAGVDQQRATIIAGSCAGRPCPSAR